MIWSAIDNDKIAEIKDSFDITLEVIDGESEKVLATAKVTVTTDDTGFYSIKE